MGKYSCEVERVSNGFIVRHSNIDEEDDSGIEVFEDCEDGDDDFEEEALSILSVFYSLMDYFGIYNSKYNKKQLRMFIANSDECCDDCKSEIAELRTENDSMLKEINRLSTNNLIKEINRLRSENIKLLKGLSNSGETLMNTIQIPKSKKDKL